MKPALIALPLALILTGCGLVGPEGEAQRDAIKQIALDRIEAFNAAGVDPVRLNPTQLLALQTACAFAPTLTTTWRPDAPEASSAVVDTCAVLMAIAPEAGA